MSRHHGHYRGVHGWLPWRRWRHSIRWRLVTLFLALALLSIGVFVLGSQQLLRGAWQGYARPLVADYVDRLAAEIGSPPDLDKARALTQRLPLAIRIEGPVVQFDSHPQRTATHRRADPWSPDDAAANWGLTRQTADGHRLSFGPGSPAEGHRPRIFGWVSLAALLLLTALAYRVVRQLLLPLDGIGKGVEAFGRGEFGTPIAVTRDDELGDLARRVNDMAASLHGMLEAKRTLLLAISHELRSPLTRARLNAELMDDSPTREALLQDLAEMRDLITDLLESERLSVGHAALQPQALALEPWIREQLASLGGEPAVALDIAADLGTVQADPARLRMVLRNLIHNARQHGAAADGRGPQLRAWRERSGSGDRVCIEVRDFGPGVTAEQLALLAEPFYRTDAARLRRTGGVGLGLHLSRQVVQAHGGRLVFERAEPGLRVRLSLPA